MSVEIKEVKSRIQLREWVDFPNKMYKNVPAFTPFMFSDEMAMFTRASNPAYEFCDTKLFSAYKDGKMVGRIAGLINYAANEKWGTNNIRFTRFDFIDDYEISEKLFTKVVEWGKEKGFTKIIGPIGFTDMDHEGMLIEGYDELNMSLTFYNFPYYLTHLEKLGLEKEVDWVEFQVKVPQTIDPKYKKLSNYLMTRGGYELVTYSSRKALWADAYEAFRLIDKAFSVLYGTVPLTEKVVEKALNDYIPVINLKYICSIKDKNNEIVGFAVLVPSIVKALKKSNGRLFPLGIFRMLNALNGQNDILEMFFVAVKPELQKTGLPAILMSHIIEICVENGVKVCETGPELETNESVQSMWKGFDVRQHRRRRCFRKQI